MGGVPTATSGLGWVAGRRQNQGKMSRIMRTARQRSERGFTLVEIMIAVAIVAILAAVALPSFMDSVRKSRRTEAFNAISNVQQLQERWRSNHGSYAGSLTAAAGDDPPGLGLSSAQTAKGYYDLALADVGAAAYTVTATAKDGTSQANDSRCLVLAARVAGGNLSYGAGAGAIDWTAANPDPDRCWAR